VSAFTEGDFFQTTSNLLNSIQKLSPESFKSQDIARFVRYLKDQEETTETPERNYLFYRSANIFSNVPIATLETKSLVKGQDFTLRTKITNLLNEEVKNVKALKVKGGLYGKDTQDTTIAISSDIVFEKKSNGIYEGKLKESDGIKPGNYQFRLTVSDGTSNYDVIFSFSAYWMKLVCRKYRCKRVFKGWITQIWNNKIFKLI